jgi:hypothetical protein
MLLRNLNVDVVSMIERPDDASIPCAVPLRGYGTRMRVSSPGSVGPRGTAYLPE